MIDHHALPASWKVAKLEDVARWGSGGTPKRTVPRYFGGDIPWVVIGDLADGPVSGSTTYITREGLANSSAKWVAPGSVLVAMYGSIGKLGLTTRRLTTNQAIAFAMPRDGVVSSKYLFWYLRAIRRELVASGRGGTQQNISQTTLKPLPISLPSLSQQGEVVEQLESQVTRIDAIETALRSVQRRLKVLHSSILHAAWDGTILAPAAPSNGTAAVTLADLVGDAGLLPGWRLGGIEGSRSGRRCAVNPIG